VIANSSEMATTSVATRSEFPRLRTKLPADTTLV
jgi:hypothetical protein